MARPGLFARANGEGVALDNLKEEYVVSAITVSPRPCALKSANYSAGVLGGFLRLARWCLTASITRSG